MDENLIFDKERFVGACELVSLIEAENSYIQSTEIKKGSTRPVNHISREGETNIGGLGEGTLHLVLKNYISANRFDQEVKYKRKYIDVFLDGKAYEIQTRNFHSLKSKLDVFLPDFPVTVVFPVIREKYVSTVDKSTGEITAPRKSPKKENIYTIFSELIYIADYLGDRNLSFCVFEMSANETKLIVGKKGKYANRTVRLDRVPTELFGISYFENASDFIRLLPDGVFSVKELSSFAGIQNDLASKVVYSLSKANIIYNVGKRGREKLYAAPTHVKEEQK